MDVARRRRSTSLDTRPDFHCGLMNLLLRLGIVDVTGSGAPYLRADSGRSCRRGARRSARKSPLVRGNLKVGLVWNGNPEHIRDKRRSVPVEQLEPLSSTANVSFLGVIAGAW